MHFGEAHLHKNCWPCHHMLCPLPTWQKHQHRLQESNKGRGYTSIFKPPPPVWHSTLGWNCATEKRNIPQQLQSPVTKHASSNKKETTFQILNRTIWTQNKAFKSGLTPDPTCMRCNAPETMEHLLYICKHYSAKIWALLGRAIMLSLSWHTGKYIPDTILTPLEIVFNEPHPSLLLQL